MKRARRSISFFALLASAALGCNAIFGLGDYRVDDGDAAIDSAVDTASEAGEAAPSCSMYDAAGGQCFPCTPTLDPEFLNACTGAQCVPFDDTTRVRGVLADGGLPPVPDRMVPPTDGGVD